MRDFEPERDAAVVERTAAAFAHTLDAATRAGLCGYVEQVASWNQKINLTGARDPEALCEVLLADAFALATPTLVPPGARIIDVGTGAGAPILPLLVLRPDLRARCLEPLHKRVTFLRTVSARLGLVSRIEVRAGKLDPAQSLATDGVFDVACSRATFAPERWLALALGLAPRVLVLVGDAAPPEAPPGVQRCALEHYSLPFSGTPRTIAVYLRE